MLNAKILQYDYLLMTHKSRWLKEEIYMYVLRPLPNHPCDDSDCQKGEKESGAEDCAVERCYCWVFYNGLRFLGG